MRLKYLFLCGIALSGCSRGGSPKPHSGDEVALVCLHADLLMLNRRASLTRQDSSSVVIGKDSLYENWGFSKSTYERELENYKRDLSDWKEFNLKVVARLEELQKAQATRKTRLSHDSRDSI